MLVKGALSTALKSSSHRNRNSKDKIPYTDLSCQCAPTRTCKEKRGVQSPWPSWPWPLRSGSQQRGQLVLVCHVGCSQRKGLGPPGSFYMGHQRAPHMTAGENFSETPNSSTVPLMLQRRRRSYCSPGKDAADQSSEGSLREGSIQGMGASAPDRDIESECTEWAFPR